MKRNKPLQRHTPLARSRKPIRRATPKRANQLREYAKRRVRFLAEHPICGVWLKQNGWQQIGIADSYVRQKVATVDFVSAHCLRAGGAPAATEIHHRAKRRGALLLEEAFWLQVCAANHELIEQHKSWARENGFLLNF